MFPDIDHEFLREVAAQHSHNADATINHIVDEEEAGRPYAKIRQKTTKRKRDDGADDEFAEADDEMTRLRRRYDNPRRRAMEVGENGISSM